MKPGGSATPVDSAVVRVLFEGEHVPDLFDGGVDDEHAATEHDQAVHVERSLDDVATVDAEDRVLHILDELDQREEKRDAQADRQTDTDAPNALLVGLRSPFGLQRDVEQVIEPQDHLEQDEKTERDDVVDHGCSQVSDAGGMAR